MSGLHERRLTLSCCVAGTLKDDQHCYLCGQNGHRQFECPNQPDEVYKLPNQMQEKVQAQYERDIVRMAGPGEAPREPSHPADPSTGLTFNVVLVAMYASQHGSTMLREAVVTSRYNCISCLARPPVLGLRRSLTSA